jgi:hypothetical protein|tara:strand:- start:1179 stop:2075 length:897 start_codon:yes stop_codon:yes gene_type:complete
MTSQFTSRIRLEKQEDGANPNSWGTVLNQNVIDLIDDAIAAYVTVSLSSIDVTLTNEDGASDQARKPFIELQGALTANVNIVIPQESKGYFIRNKTTRAVAETTTIKTLPGTGATVGVSSTGWFVCDGVSVHQPNATGLGLGTAANLDFGTADSNLIPVSTADIRFVRASVSSTIPSAKTFTSAVTFTGPGISPVVSLTDAASVAVNMALGNNFAITLAGNRTLGAPAGVTPGQTGHIYLVQDGTGSRTLAFATAYTFASGTAPTLSTGANAVDLLIYNAQTTTAISTVVVKAFSTAT